MTEPQSLEWTDRYGGPAHWPDPATVCPGPCEGLGVYPDGEPLGTTFTRCPVCGGTGRRPTPEPLGEPSP